MGEITTRQVGGGRFTFLDGGSPDRPALVFIHGIGGGAGLWRRQLAAFGADYHAVAWNLPGYGGAAPLREPNVDAYASALAEFLDAAGLKRPVLVGHSIGGMIVQSLLAEGLAPVRASVLAQTSPAFGGRDPAWARDFVTARLEPLERGETMASLAEANVAGMVGTQADPEGLALAREVMAKTPEAAYRASTLAMIGFDRRGKLDALDLPLLLLAGSEDRNAPEATMAKMAERLKRARFVSVPGAGHLLMLERPAVFDAALRDFLSTLDP